MAANFTKHGERTPGALLEYLAVHQPKLTVAEFASVLKKNWTEKWLCRESKGIWLPVRNVLKNVILK